MPYVDDYDTIVNRPIDDDVARSRDDEAAEVRPKFGSSCPHIRVLRKA